jgi:hypothetical protein
VDTFRVTDPSQTIVRAMSPKGTAGASTGLVSNVVTIRVPLSTTGGTASADLLSWINPESGTIAVTVTGYHWTTTGTGTIDMGVSSDGTGASDNIINGGTMNNVGALTVGHRSSVAGTAGTVGVAQHYLLGPGGTGTNNSIVAKTAETATTAVGHAIIQYFVVS